MNYSFTDRTGGLSTGAFLSCNLATHVGDDHATVIANRARLESELGLPIQFMEQVHGNTVATIDRQIIPPPTADALLTQSAGIGLAVMVADCIPLLLRSESLVAAIHVGRAGLMNSIALKTVAQMRELGAKHISGSIGPAICGSCYEVPKDLHDQVIAVHPLASSKTRFGTSALDLPKALIAALALVDVPVVISASCTLEDDVYFSYRRNQVTGRQAGVIKL